jgi:clan AA aspartic protease (TIGR02281 family)
MNYENGVYTTPCTINGLKLRFIFDTGASTVCISLTEAIFMLKNGYMDESDIHGSSYSEIANGNVIENTTVTLREMEIGGIKLNNINAVVIHELAAPLLLGQTAIAQLGRLQINGDELLIMDKNKSLIENVSSNAFQLVTEGDNYYSKELWNLAADSYKKAYEINSSIFNCNSFYQFMSALNYCDNYSLCVKYSENANLCLADLPTLTSIYMEYGKAYFRLQNNDNAILNFEKALNIANDDFRKAFCHYYLADIYYTKMLYNKSNEHFELSSEYQLKYISFSKEDVTRGRVKDDKLGSIYLGIGQNYQLMYLYSKRNEYFIKAAKCGYIPAIETCLQYNLKY